MKDKHVHLVYEQLLLISQSLTDCASLADAQNLIRQNQEIQSFVIHSEKSKPSSESSPNQSLQFLIHEIKKFLNTHETPHVRHRFDCLLVPFERYLQKKTTDSDFLVSTIDKTTARKPFPVRLILENLRSEFNVGSIFRSAESFGVEQISLCGYTPLPLKADMGTRNKIPHCHQSIVDAITQAKQNKFTVIALETVHQGMKIHDAIQSEKICFVLGNERHGLMPATLNLCDAVVQIPLFGNKNSLNVGVAAGISLYEYHRSKCHL